jgi:hypothetical protein
MKEGPINITDLGLDESFERIDRLEKLIHELQTLVNELYAEDIHIVIKLELK